MASGAMLHPCTARARSRHPLLPLCSSPAPHRDGQAAGARQCNHPVHRAYSANHHRRQGEGAGSAGGVEPVESKGRAGQLGVRACTSAAAAGKRWKCCTATQACAVVCATVAFAHPQAFACALL